MPSVVKSTILGHDPAVFSRFSNPISRSGEDPLISSDVPKIAILHQNTGMQLIVYSAFWCPDCREAKRFLDRHNIPYQEIDIETTPGAAQEVIRRTGKRAIPQFVIDGEWVQPYRPGEGFLYEEMSELLGLK